MKRALTLVLYGLTLLAQAQTYDPRTRLLVLPTVAVGTQSYVDVQVRLDRFEVVSIGSPVATVTTYDPAGGILSLPTVSAAGADSHSNVHVRLFDFEVLSVGTPPATGAPTRIYVNLVSHNEDTATGSNADCQAFFSDFGAHVSSNNAALEAIAGAAKARGATFSLQTDVEYLDLVAATESAQDNVLRRLLAANPGTVEVDAHAHESFRKNYADVANRVEQVAGVRTGVVGGYTAAACRPDSAAPTWSKFRAPLAPASGQGPSFVATLLTLGASAGHVCDPDASGVWRPSSESDFFSDDPAQTLVSVGTGNGSQGLSEGVAALTDLVADYKAGRLQPNRMYTFSVTIAQCNLHRTDRGVSPAEVTAFIDAVNALDDASDFIRWATFSRLLDIWRTEYGMQPSVWRRP
jgi:hypothetical protein